MILDSERQREVLVNLLKSTTVPYEGWDEMVAIRDSIKNAEIKNKAIEYPDEVQTS